MKALYIGSTDPNSCAVFYAEALTQLDWEVTRFDPSYFTNLDFFSKIALKLMKSPPTAKIQSADENLLRLCRAHSFDLILVIAENFLSHLTLQDIKGTQKKKPLILYHSHDNNFSNGILKPADFWQALATYDFAFTTKSQNVLEYRKRGVKEAHYIPSAYSERVHKPIPAEKSRYSSSFPVSFVGTYDKSRDPVFDNLDWEKLHIWGNNWTRSRHFKTHRDHITPKAIYGDAYSDVTSHSQISLGLLREEAEDRHTQRTFEIPACGSFQLAPRNDEILSFFDEGKEIVCFGTLEEMRDKTDFYLKHETERSKIAKLGHERVIKDKHSYRDRVETMLRVTGVVK